VTSALTPSFLSDIKMTFLCVQEGSDCSSDLEQRDLSLDSIVTTNGAIQERRPGPVFPPRPPPSPLIPTAVSADSHSPANRNQPPPSVAAGRAAQPAVNFILGHLHDRRPPAVLVPSGGNGGSHLMQTGREKTMTAPLLMTDPRRWVQAGSSLVQVGRTTPDETRQQQLTSLSEEEKLTAIFVSTLGGTVAAVPTADPGDDETSDGIAADGAEITGREKRIVAVACLTKFNSCTVYLLYNRLAPLWCLLLITLITVFTLVNEFISMYCHIKYFFTLLHISDYEVHGCLFSSYNQG
jgi:hypothetical protein